ncbi:MAG: hypothetical protein EP348_10680 [Alphaproteobacteria bacterium]|nr:MAG: hypothetical protein EP348_10680 [Alphaproteobacteria bacterium]
MSSVLARSPSAFYGNPTFTLNFGVRRMRRGLTILMIFIVLLFCGAIAAVYLSIGPVIKSAVEDYGTAITGAKVTLGKSDFSPSSGNALLENLKVANPAHYSEGTAISTNKVELQIDPKSLESGVLVITRLKIEAPEILYEITETGDNLRTIRTAIKAAMARESDPAAKPFHPGLVNRFIVRDLYISNGVVVVEAKNLMGKRATAVLDPIHLSDIGKAEGGLPPAALVNAIYTPLLQNVTLAALSTDLNLSDQARNILSGASDETEAVIDKIRKIFGK